MLAAALRPRLVGRRLVDGRLRGRPDLVLSGRSVDGVRARGKHLFVELDGGVVLRSHLGMHGTWHRYRPGEGWRKPQRHAAVVLATDDDVLVCFHPEEVELMDARRLGAFGLRRNLGPDLVECTPDPEEAHRRARVFLPAEAPAVDVLLDQRVASGIGNVYKSEVLFLEGTHPLTPLARMDAALLSRLHATAHRLLAANLGGGRRATRDIHDGRGTEWVYGRTGKPCLRCDGPVFGARLGRGNRDTYWCSHCQPLPVIEEA